MLKECQKCRKGQKYFKKYQNISKNFKNCQKKINAQQFEKWWYALHNALQTCQ